MTSAHRLVRLALFGAALAAPAGAAEAQKIRVPDFEMEMVEGHNAARAEVGAPPVTWSQDLADQARAWAEVNLKKGTLEHSPQANRPGQGENLAAVYGARVGGTALLRQWTAEREHYLYGPLQCDAGFHAVGHYTQMVWSGTREIGCGLASNGRSQVLVCRYAPPGNICGEAPY